MCPSISRLAAARPKILLPKTRFLRRQSLKRSRGRGTKVATLMPQPQQRKDAHKHALEGDGKGCVSHGSRTSWRRPGTSINPFLGSIGVSKGTHAHDHHIEGTIAAAAFARRLIHCTLCVSLAPEAEGASAAVQHKADVEARLCSSYALPACVAPSAALHA